MPSTISTHRLRLALLAASLLTLGGCGSWSLFKSSCARPEDFAGVIDNPPLKIPSGRDAPDTRAALVVPPLETPELPRPADAPCIDTPPKFNPAPPRRPQA